MGLPLCLEVLRYVDVGAIIYVLVKHSHKEAQESRQLEAARKDDDQEDRKLDSVTDCEDELSAVKIGDAGDNETPDDLSYVVDPTDAIDLEARHTHEVKGLHPVFQRVNVIRVDLIRDCEVTLTDFLCCAFVVLWWLCSFNLTEVNWLIGEWVDVIEEEVG